MCHAPAKPPRCPARARLRRLHGGAPLVVVLLLLAREAMPAQQAPSELDRLVREALASNPDVAAALARRDAARARPAREGGLPDPMLTSTVIRFRDRGVGVRGEGETWYALRQEIPFPGKLGLRAEAARREADVAEAELEALRLDLVEAVRVAFYRALHARGLEEIALANAQLVEGTLGVARARYEVGAGDQPDLLLARVERARIANDLAAYRAMRREALAELDALLGRPAALEPGQLVEPASPRPTPTPDVDSLVARALAQSPELRAARLAASRDTLALRLAGKAYLPDFSVGLEYWVGEGENPEPLPDERYVLVAGLTLPWIWKGKHDAGVREARASLRAGESAVLETTNRIRSEVEAAAAVLDAAAEQVRTLEETILPEAVLNVEGAAEAYRTDRAGFLTLVDAQRSLNELRVAQHTALVELLTARARLDRALGEPPPEPGGDGVASAGDASRARKEDAR